MVKTPGGPELDLSRYPDLAGRLRGLESAFDGPGLTEPLQAALFGAANPDYKIERCTLNHAIFLPESERCNLCYELEIRTRNGSLQRLAVARLFANADDCRTYLREKLVPLAGLAAGRDEVSVFAAPVATLEPWNVAVSVFPIDGELPTLVDATDPRRMVEIFREALPAVRGEDLVVEGCRAEVAQYRRRGRCVLRYHVDCRRADAGHVEPILVYGKVHDTVRDAIPLEVMGALRERVSGEGAYRFHVPRPLGVWPDLHLALLEAIPGKRRLTRLLKKRIRGAPDKESRLTLEDALDACARIAASMHTSGIPLGPRWTADDELAKLSAAISTVEPLSPSLGRQLRAWHGEIGDRANASEPLPRCLGHGDFSESQLLFHGNVGGLVDFDTVCQAEPARDLGQFLGYLQISIRKVSSSSPLADELRQRFLRTYFEAAGIGQEEQPRFSSRVFVYETTTLVRLAVKGWLKFKRERLDHALALVDGLLSENATGGSAYSSPRNP